PMRMFASSMTLRQRFRRWRKRTGPRVPKASWILVVELLVAILVLAIAFTGKRGAFLDWLHPRADAVLGAGVAALVAVLHFYVVTRLLPELRRRASPAQYDQQRILLDLSDAARHSNNLADVYTFSVNAIARALETDDVSILVSDQTTGDLLLRSSSTQKLASGAATNGGEAEARAEALALTKDAFVVRRLNKLSQPLRIDAG